MHVTFSRRRPGRRAGKSRGQSLVEFALVLPILMLILLFSIDFGRVFLGWVQLNNAARIAANYAAAGQPPLTSAQLTQYQALINRETAGLSCDLDTIPNPTYPSNVYSVGGQAISNVTCTFHPITPFIAGFFGGGLKVSASANFPIRAGVLGNLGGGGGTTYVAPNQDFTVSPTTGLAPLIVNVTLGTQNGGAAQTWAWDFGDGTTSSLEVPGQHTYNTAGTYTITLQESNPGGTSATFSHSVTVSDPAAAPVADFYGLVPAPCVDSGAPLAESCGGPTGTVIYYRYNPNPTLTFYDRSQNVTGATYAWDFGDPLSGTSNTSTLQTPTHTYVRPGAYTITLTVTTGAGSNTATRTNYVNLGCIVPTLVGLRTNGSGNAASAWSAANFLSTTLFYWSGGSYSTGTPSPPYTVGQQNPQALAFFNATPSGASYACTNNGRIAPANVTPAP